MKIFLGTFVPLFILLAFSFGNRTSQNSQKELDQLRKEYLSDKAALDQINKTKEEILEKNKDQKMPNSGPEWKKHSRNGFHCGKKRRQVIPNI